MARTVLITGTSSGIGRATAGLFHERGWNVAATMRDPAAEHHLSSLDGVLVSRLDVTDPGSIATAVDAALQRFGSVDVLVNNAGYAAYGILEAFSMERVDRQFRTNVLGLVAVTKALLPHMRARRDGVIVNLSSIGGRMTFPLGTLYHGSKFAVEGLSEALQFELAPLGIRVKIIEPAPLDTDFGGRSLDFANDESLSEYQPVVRAVLAGFDAVGKTAATADVAAEVIYAAATDGSDQLRYRAGEQADAIIGARETSDDRTFLDGIRKQFAL
ncbi:SDR family oxidoreductase [Actinoplanes sp. TBRC 11911]|uniref:SDR family oxidoreductase n=1 Tax=Actinoplanes sp. TBRC 11911 TaxID=2729386 RepID=UPI00145DEA4E|nr:SDR family oxidoreductase [Actinoplanes sp. TBRC 11911]NMO57836.1 SDR family oxidoreductase [Actinoplanes sp. TBRC 11911]